MRKNEGQRTRSRGTTFKKSRMKPNICSKRKKRSLKTPPRDLTTVSAFVTSEMREKIEVDHQFKLLEGEIEELEYKISDAEEEIRLKKREIELRKPEVQSAKRMKKFSGKLIGLNFSTNERTSLRNSRNETRDTFTDERLESA